MSGIERTRSGAHGRPAGCGHRLAWCVVVSLSVIPMRAGMADVTQGEMLTLNAAEALAVANNPGLDELRERARAADAVPSQAGSLPDPRITLGAANVPVDSFALAQEPMTQLQVGVSQAFPFPGKRALRRDMAKSEAAVAADTVEEARIRLILAVRNAWWELFYLDRAADTIERNRGLLRQLVDVARVKYEVGRGLQQDVLLAQVEFARLDNEAIQITGKRANTVARMNALLARPSDAPMLLPATVSAPLPNIAGQSQLEAQADESRPWVARARHQLEAARSAQELARKEYFPEFGASVSYGRREGYNNDGSRRADFATIMLSVSVPLFFKDKQDQLVAQRRAERRAGERALADATNRVRADIAAATADYRQARQELALLDSGILPQTRQAVASMLEGYQVNKVDFLTLVRTQITLYNYETQRWRALSQAHQALAALAATVGRERIDE